MQTTQSDIRELALKQFRKDFPGLALHFGKLRVRAESASVGGEAAPRRFGFYPTPPSNTGVNESKPVAGGFFVTGGQS